MNLVAVANTDEFADTPARGLPRIVCVLRRPHTMIEHCRTVVARLR
jgi:hypothetical protein